MKTYDLQFHSDESSDSAGFKMSLDEATAALICKAHGYFNAYKGWIAQVVCNETDEVAIAIHI